MIGQASFPIPPTLNKQINLARTHWAKSADCKTEWTQNIALLAANQLPRFEGQVWLDFLWLVPNKNSDPDNTSAAAKYLMDGLVKAGILKGDSLSTINSPVVHRFDKGNGEVILTISSEPIWELKSNLPSNLASRREAPRCT